MSSKTESLSAFLEKYLRSKNTEVGAMSFAEYETLNPNLQKSGYLNALEKRYSERARNKSYYGKSAEALANASLTASGYSAFLEREANLASDAEVGEKYALYKAADAENMTGYLNYLDNYAKEIRKLKTSVSDSLIKNNVVSKDEAYEYALGAGLSESDALAISKNVYGTARRNLLNTVTERITDFELDAEGAKLYARTLGFDEEDVDYVGKYAEALIERRGEGGEDYIEYLRQKANKKYNK